MKRYWRNFPRVRLGHNPTWVDSFALAFFGGVIWAPMTLLNMLKGPLWLIIRGIVGLITALVVFVVYTLVVVIAGIVGWLEHAGWGHFETPKPETKSASDPQS